MNPDRLVRAWSAATASALVAHPATPVETRKALEAALRPGEPPKQGAVCQGQTPPGPLRPSTFSRDQFKKTGLFRYLHRRVQKALRVYTWERSE